MGGPAAGDGDVLDDEASTRPGPEAGMGVAGEVGLAGAVHRASTRPGPEAGMGAHGALALAAAQTGLQRGPARRPGWAPSACLLIVALLACASTRPGPEAGMGAMNMRKRTPPAIGFNEARPGGRDGRSSQPSPSAMHPVLQRGPARRPGWAGLDSGAASRIISRLQRGPARRPGWARARTRRPAPTRIGFNEARPGGRDGRTKIALFDNRLGELQRGPARRPGWATTRRRPPSS